VLLQREHATENPHRNRVTGHPTHEREQRGEPDRAKVVEEQPGADGVMPIDHDGEDRGPRNDGGGKP
jgi:hypothetical protein